MRGRGKKLQKQQIPKRPVGSSPGPFSGTVYVTPVFHVPPYPPHHTGVAVPLPRQLLDRIVSTKKFDVQWEDARSR